jgi:DNA-binding response OmpR family regulator
MDRILLLISHKENRRLLGDFLSKRYEVLLGEDERILEEKFDLCIIDGLALTKYRRQVQARIDGQKPVLLPVLLLTSRHNVNMVTANLWQVIDDLLVTPIEKAELLARVESILRSRRLSLELKEIRMALDTSEKKVERLQEELDRLNQLFQT